MGALRWFRWVGLVVSVVLIAVWISSGWWHVRRFSAGGRLVGIGSGILIIGGFGGGPPTSRWETGTADGPALWWFNWDGGPGAWVVLIPLWAPAGLSALLTAAAWKWHARIRQREGRGRCLACGYDLAGLPAGAVCPECGVRPEDPGPVDVPTAGPSRLRLAARSAARYALLGALTTIAVAWGLSWRVDLSYARTTDFYAPLLKTPVRLAEPVPAWPLSSGTTKVLPRAPWRMVLLAATGSRRVIVTGHHDVHFFGPLEPNLPPEGARMLVSRDQGASILGWAGRQWMVCDTRGWPFAALSCTWPWWDWVGGRYPPVAGGVPLPRHEVKNGFRQAAMRALPLRPLWGGFLLNAAFYAGLWWLVRDGRAAVLRVVRRRRGRCPNCAYDRTGLPPGAVCPECGESEQVAA